MRSDRVGTAMRRDCGGGLPHRSWTSMPKEGVPASTAALLACLSTLTESLGGLARACLQFSLAVAGDGRQEARSCPTRAPCYPSCPSRNYCSSDPRGLERSRSFSGSRVPHLPWALPPTTTRCWRGCVRRGADVCTAGPVLSPFAGDRKGSSSGAAAALDPRASCL